MCQVWCKIIDCTLRIKPVKRRNRNEWRYFYWCFKVHRIGFQSPVILVIAVIGPYDDLIAQKVIHSYAEGKFKAASRQLFRCFRIIIKINPVKRQT